MYQLKVTLGVYLEIPMSKTILAISGSLRIDPDAYLYVNDSELAEYHE